MNQMRPERSTENKETELLQMLYDNLKLVADILLQQPKRSSLMEKRELGDLGKLHWFRLDEHEIQVVATQYLPKDDERHFTGLAKTSYEVSSTFQKDGEDMYLADVAEPFLITVPGEGSDGKKLVYRVVPQGEALTAIPQPGDAFMTLAELAECTDFTKRVVAEFTANT